MIPGTIRILILTMADTTIVVVTIATAITATATAIVATGAITAAGMVITITMTAITMRDALRRLSAAARLRERRLAARPAVDKARQLAR